MDRQTALRILSRVREVKQASETAIPATDPVTAANEAVTQSAQTNALRDVGRVALWSAGLGIAGRGAMGLYNVLKRNLAPPPKLRSHVAVLPLPVRGRPREEEKTAGFAEFLHGNMATTKEGIPWYKPAMLLGGLAAGYGGWKAVDAVLDARRKAEMREEVEKAKQDFAAAMIGGHSKPVKFKIASDESDLGRDLEKLAEDFEKLALLGLENLMPGADTMGSAVGAYGLYAVPAALLAGHAAYTSATKRNRAKVLEKALKQRAMRRQQVQPAEMYAMPVPVEVEKEEA